MHIGHLEEQKILGSIVEAMKRTQYIGQEISGRQTDGVFGEKP
jgi:hypothetical protein